MTMTEAIWAKTKEIEPQVIAIRRHLHENPELSFVEFETMALVQQHLQALDIPFEIVENGGIIGIIKGKKPGNTIALRADMDALPMQELANNLKQRKTVVSKVPNVAHMCGHDAHTAILMGAATILTDLNNEGKLAGDYVLVFEQAEERGGGAQNVLYTLQQSYNIDSMWAIHTKADFPVGYVSVEAGPRMSSAFFFDVTIHGKSGHGSRPDLAISPIECFSDFHQRIQMARLTKLNPFDPITISVGSLHAGAAANVIPDTLTFTGTCRFLQYEQGQKFAKLFQQILAETCASYNCLYTLAKPVVASNIFVNNHPALSGLAEETLAAFNNHFKVATCPAWMASEPYGQYGRYYPTIFMFLGIQNAELGSGAEHHHPAFDLDERSLAYGVASTVAYATAFNASDKSNVPFTPVAESVEAMFERLNLVKPTVKQLT